MERERQCWLDDGGGGCGLGWHEAGASGVVSDWRLTGTEAATALRSRLGVTVSTSMGR